MFQIAAFVKNTAARTHLHEIVPELHEGLLILRYVSELVHEILILLLDPCDVHIIVTVYKAGFVFPNNDARTAMKVLLPQMMKIYNCMQNAEDQACVSQVRCEDKTSARQ